MTATGGAPEAPAKSTGIPGITRTVRPLCTKVFAGGSKPPDSVRPLPPEPGSMRIGTMNLFPIKCRITNDELQMTKESEAQMPNDAQECDRRFCHSDFGIPLDFVIRHSDLGIAAHGKPLRPCDRAMVNPAWNLNRRGEDALHDLTDLRATVTHVGQRLGLRREAKRHAALDCAALLLPNSKWPKPFSGEPKRRRRCALPAHSKRCALAAESAEDASAFGARASSAPLSQGRLRFDGQADLWKAPTPFLPCIGTLKRSESPSTALRAPSPPVGEKDGMRGSGSWKGSLIGIGFRLRRTAKSVRHTFLLAALFLLLNRANCGRAAHAAQIQSPDGLVEFRLFQRESRLTYAITFKNKPVIEASPQRNSSFRRAARSGITIWKGITRPSMPKATWPKSATENGWRRL